jgi:hypothetical protein
MVKSTGSFGSVGVNVFPFPGEHAVTRISRTRSEVKKLCTITLPIIITMFILIIVYKSIAEIYPCEKLNLFPIEML